MVQIVISKFPAIKIKQQNIYQRHHTRHMRISSLSINYIYKFNCKLLTISLNHCQRNIHCVSSDTLLH